MLEGVLTAFSTLLVIILILVLTFVCTKYIGKTTRFRKLPGDSRYMEMVDQIILGQESSVAIVRVSGRIFLLGITPHEITLLKDLDQDELVSLPYKEEAFGAGIDFKEIIGKIKDRKK